MCNDSKNTTLPIPLPPQEEPCIGACANCRRSSCVRGETLTLPDELLPYDTE